MERKEELYDQFKEAPQNLKTTPLWFWQDAVKDMEEDKVREIVRESFYQSGYNGFSILPAFLSAKTEYKKYIYEDEKFFKLYEAALCEAHKLNMDVILYDEDGWPSGGAGGLVVKEHPQYGTRRLDKREFEGLVGESIQLPEIDGDYLGAVLMEDATKQITDVSCDIQTLLVQQNDRIYTFPYHGQGTVRLMIFSCVIEGNKGVDYLNADAVKTYIQIVYEKFYEKFSEYFGNTIKKAFYDEPTMWKFREAGTTGNRTWTTNFNEEFKRRYPQDNPMLLYPALFYDIGPSTQMARYKLFSVRSDLFSVSYVKQINDWCKKHGVQFMGHTYSEEQINPVSNTGDLMRFFKFQDIPGVDHIVDRDRAHNISRIITSSAYNWDKELIMSETFGAAGEDLPVSELFTWAMDEYAAGINYIVPHAIWYDEKGVFYPPELSYRSKKFGPHLKKFNTYISRLNVLLRGGRHVADIGVLYPIDYLKTVTDLCTEEICSPTDADYQTILTYLSQDIRKDFTFLHPETFNERCTVKEQQIFLNNHTNFEAYNTLILPGMKVISLANLEKVREFFYSGGKVISTTCLPYLGISPEENERVCKIVKEIFGVDPVSGETKEADILSESVIKNRNEKNGVSYYIKNLTSERLEHVLKEANDTYDVEIAPRTVKEGRLTYIHKVRENLNVYFIANSGKEQIDTEIILRGNMKTEIWDPHTGMKMNNEGKQTKNVDGTPITRVSITIPAETSLFIIGDYTV